MVPVMDEDRCAPPCTSYDLAAICTPIATCGTRALCVVLLPGSRFPWAFVVTNEEQAILGMDFFAAHDLLVDPRHRFLPYQP